MQRSLFQTVIGGQNENARASAARAWKELEILRRAIKGQPLILGATAKAEMPVKPREVPGNLIVLAAKKTSENKTSQEETAQSDSQTGTDGK